MNKKKIIAKSYKISLERYVYDILLNHEERIKSNKNKKCLKIFFSKYRIDRRKRKNVIINLNKHYGLKTAIKGVDR